MKWLVFITHGVFDCASLSGDDVIIKIQIVFYIHVGDGYLVSVSV